MDLTTALLRRRGNVGARHTVTVQGPRDLYEANRTVWKGGAISQLHQCIP